MTTLSFPKSIETASKPPPTRAEVIEALALTEYENQLEASRQHSEKVKVMKAELESEVAAYVKAQIHSLESEVRLGYVGCSDGKPIYGLKVVTELLNIPKAMRGRLLKFHEMKAPTVMTLRDIRNQLREKLINGGSKSERVATLLTTKKDDLQKMLKVLAKQ